jgi:ABC-2 type transport system permease protein
MTHALRSEWTKLAGLRGTWWSLATALVLTVLLSLVITGSSSTDGCPSREPGCDDDLLEIALGGVYLGQLAVVALGVMAIGSEFTSGMIRTTFAATPRRHLVLAAKAAVVGGSVLVVGLIACALAYVLGSATLSGNGYTQANGYEAVSGATAVRGVLGSAVYLAALALLSIGVGTILRSTAAAISTVLGVLWVPLILVSMLPMDVGLKVARFCPMFAGLAIQRSVDRFDTIPISPGAGLALFCAYAAAALAGGFWILTRRDA